MTKKSHRYAIALDAKTLAELARLSKAAGETRSVVLRRLIHEAAQKLAQIPPEAQNDKPLL